MQAFSALFGASPVAGDLHAPHVVLQDALADGAALVGGVGTLLLCKQVTPSERCRERGERRDETDY